MSVFTRRGLVAGFMWVAGALISAIAGQGTPPSVPQVEQPPSAPQSQVPAGSAGVLGPRIQFESQSFDFGKAVSGQLVKHIYYFTNTGDQDLVIGNVQPGCGCTSAGEWTRVVKPGETGKIPIQFNSANYNSPVKKLVTVTSNDKRLPSIPLQLAGTVWKPIEFTPQYAGLSLRADAPFSTVVVRITNALEEPVWLSPPQSSNPAFGAELRTNSPGKEYLVAISNTMVLPQGGARGEITLATSATNIYPLIKIQTWATVAPVITVSPPVFSLPHAPLPTNFTSLVSVINNSTNPLTISEPQVNATNVHVNIQEIKPGQSFMVSLKFDPGFQMPPYPLVFTAKTSNPQMASLKVPLNEIPRPYQPAARSTQLKRPTPVASNVPRPAPLLPPTASPTNTPVFNSSASQSPPAPPAP